MNLIYTIFFLTILLIWVPWLWRYKWRPYFAKSDLSRQLQNLPDGKRLNQIAGLLTTLYRGINADSLSKNERKRLGLKEDAYIYGEIDFLSFILILDKIKPQPGEVFYDLGSGSGKAVFTAALCYDMSKACGIELLPGLCKLANMQINKARTLLSLIDKKLTETFLHQLSTIEFINSDFLNCDLSDGGIIFINATCLSYYTWEALVEKLKELRPGARIISTTKKIQNEQFEVLYQYQELMSWGMNSVNIYRKIS